MQIENVYIDFNGKICVAATDIIEIGIASLPLWKKWSSDAKRNQYTTRPGGNGRPSLIELVAIPTKYREQIVAKFGNPSKQFNPMDEFFELDGAARSFYDEYRRPVSNKSLEPYHISRYTTNASVLNALYKLREARKLLTKRLGNPRRDLKDGLAKDCIEFNEVLKNKYKGLEHTLPKHPRKLMEKLAQYKREGYACLIDGRAENSNAQVVTPEMIKLWNDIFAGQRHKPSHYEVSNKYDLFLNGKLEVVNRDTGELYDPTLEHFKPVGDRSVLNYLSEWANRVGTHSKRSGDRQKYMGKYVPYQSMKRPEYAGSIVSVDDRQPPFKWADGAGNRMWFYMAQDLGSTAITTWVYGDTKEGIITDFYREMVRSYAAYGLPLPHELECESSLNSSFANTFLSPGAMFQKTHIIANMARTKRIERTFGTLRNSYESKHEAFIGRPHAQSERLQNKAGKIKFLPKAEIVDVELRMIEEYNNELHPDQQLHPGMSRWDVFMNKQHPNLKPINWAGILPHLGHRTRTSMKLGRIELQGLARVVGFGGQVALGERLLQVMNEIEGEDVWVYWMDDKKGNVLKAHVHNNDGRFICELLDDMPSHRAELEQTEQCRKNRALTAAYRATVEGHANRMVKQITPVEIFETAKQNTKGFMIEGLDRRDFTIEKEVEILPQIEQEENLVLVEVNKKSLKNRF